MVGRNNQVNSSASSGVIGSSQSNGLPMNMFHPRPQNLRVKAKNGAGGQGAGQQHEIAQS